MSRIPIAPGLGSIVSELCLSPEIMKILDDAEEKLAKENREKNTIFTQNDVFIQIKDIMGNQSSTIKVDAYTDVYELKEIIGSNMNITDYLRRKIIILNNLNEIDKINSQNQEKPKIFLIYFILGVCDSDKASEFVPTKTVNGGKKGKKRNKTKKRIWRIKNKKIKTKKH